MKNYGMIIPDGHGADARLQRKTLTDTPGSMFLTKT